MSLPHPTPPHLTHEAPLVHLVKQVLHRGKPLRERVRQLRYRRRQPRTQPAAEVQL